MSRKLDFVAFAHVLLTNFLIVVLNVFVLRKAWKGYKSCAVILYLVLVRVSYLFAQDWAGASEYVPEPGYWYAEVVRYAWFDPVGSGPCCLYILFAFIRRPLGKTFIDTGKSGLGVVVLLLYRINDLLNYYFLSFFLLFLEICEDKWDLARVWYGISRAKILLPDPSIDDCLMTVHHNISKISTFLISTPFSICSACIPRIDHSVTWLLVHNLTKRNARPYSSSIL